MKSRILVSLMLVLALFVVLLQSTTVGGPLPGAIFTSLEDGSSVNHNLYDDKRDVYLNAGPGPNAPQTAAGLPDGYYYFQVTDPSGKTLLSMDPVYCREVIVKDGRIVKFASEGRYYTVGNGKNSQTIPAHIEGWEYGQHDYGISVDHQSLSIQLMPYKDTPNRGGEYKVWITPTDKFVGDNTSVDNPRYFHGFVPGWSKTDNYKVKMKRQTNVASLTIYKIEDVNGDGKLDIAEPGIANWEIHVEDPLGVTNIYWTDNNGSIEIDVPVDGTYIITEIVPSGWVNTATVVNGISISPTSSVELVVKAQDSLTYSVEFGNFECFKVDGYKYEDMLGDGDWDEGDLGVEGWKVTLYHSTDGGITWSEYAVTYTDKNGYYSFKVCEGGKFKVVEEKKTGWMPTSTESFIFEGYSGTSRGPYNFFNFQCFYVNGHKYEDMLGDGDWDEGDLGLEGWTITLYKKNNLNSWEFLAKTTTDSKGYYEFKVCSAGEYKVVEETRTGWQVCGDASYEFNGLSGKSLTYDFFNFKLGKICGYKWFDINKNGQIDTSEDYLEGITILLYKNGNLYAQTTTDANGKYCFIDLGPGSYVVKEVPGSTSKPYYIWAQVYPTGDWEFPYFESDSNLCNVNFGNILEYTGSLTWGYWKTHTIYGPAAHPDDTYKLLDDTGKGMKFDLPTNDNDYLIDTEAEAYFAFTGSGLGNPNASGDGRSLFRVQLLALHMNILKFTDFADLVFIKSGDAYSGKTVGDIYDAAIYMLTKAVNPDFHELLTTIDTINNNHNYSPGNHVLFPSSS